MAAKKFIPAGAGMTKRSIFEMLQMAIECFNDNSVYSDEDTIERRILFKAKDISDRDAQTYVNNTECLRDECIDVAEEDWVEARDELGLDLVDVLNSRWAGKRGA